MLDAERDAYAVHIRRIERIVASWHRGDISLDEKRAEIAEENRAYYGREYRSPRTKELITSAH